MGVNHFSFNKTEINGLIEVTPFNAQDIRGDFIKDYSKEVFEQNGITYNLQEVFYTVSHKGVVRAIHFQREKQQPKLVRCISGHVYDVVVDLRKESPTFKKWLSFDLTGENKKELLIPAGCGHGYLVIEPSIVSYKCAEKFYGDYDDGILWNDKDLAVDWHIEQLGGGMSIKDVILSDKDKSLQSFQEFMDKYGGF